MAAVAAAAIGDAPNVVAQPRIQWRMSTAWTPALDMLQGAAERLAKVVEEMSAGRFRIEVFPGGQIMPPLDWEILQFPVPVLRDLKKLSAEVVKEEAEKSPIARKVNASYTRFQAMLTPWDRVAEGAYHQYVAG